VPEGPTTVVKAATDPLAATAAVTDHRVRKMFVSMGYRTMPGVSLTARAATYARKNAREKDGTRNVAGGGIYGWGNFGEQGGRAGTARRVVMFAGVSHGQRQTTKFPTLNRTDLYVAIRESNVASNEA